MATSTYLIALGSNRCGRHGRPADEIAAAVAAIGGVRKVSPIIASAPLGPSLRRFANAVALVESEERATTLLARLKQIERSFGRRRGQRWGARVIDLDVILSSGGRWSSRTLTIPHPAFRQRHFVVGPAAAIAPDWRDPFTGLTLRQLAHRLTAPRPRPTPARAV